MDRLKRIEGCLIGGAAGDALGYAVEFSREREIFSSYGPQGITEFRLNKRLGKAIVSDDTQMTMFTAEGLIEAYKAMGEKRCAPRIRQHIAKSYQNWLFTQDSLYKSEICDGRSRLCAVPGLYSRRAPGNTCLSTLEARKRLPSPDDYIADKRNNSCGCGGVMRVAPIGTIPCDDIRLVDMEAAQAATITHSHSLGYIPAAIFAHIVHRLVFPIKGLNTLADIVEESVFTAEKLFEGDENIAKQSDCLHKAMKLSENHSTDLDNIHLLGEGWVGNEALNIAVYCALRYSDDFSAGIIASVNHNGDSDSTGAVCGNILGAALGTDAIGDKWKNDLEMIDELKMLAKDLA